MDKREELVMAGKRMLRSGLTIETWGNISLRDSETGLIYITPSGMDYEQITPDDIVTINEQQEVIQGHRKPTVETKLHLTVYQNRKDVQAVLHTHPIYAQIFACLHEDIPPIIDEAAEILAGTVYCAPYALPASAELAENVTKTLAGGCACLMANHGALCVGGSLNEVFLIGTVLEMTAKIYYMARCIGKPVILDEEKVHFMRDFVLHTYGQQGE